ncbi:hypothetical protein GCM10010284_68020 [Streptomyces rubiginosohelvolus]|nr:hypothetical protein GCM10010284_68020 [Streptomyces rubiginosohelvolus]
MLGGGGDAGGVPDHVQARVFGGKDSCTRPPFLRGRPEGRALVVAAEQFSTLHPVSPGRRRARHHKPHPTRRAAPGRHRLHARQWADGALLISPHGAYGPGSRPDYAPRDDPGRWEWQGDTT